MTTGSAAFCRASNWNCWTCRAPCVEGSRNAGGRRSDERFRVIDFSVSVDVTPEFRQAVAGLPADAWKDVVHPVRRGQKTVMEKSGHQYAEVGFVPNELARSKKNPDLRYVAIRNPIKDKRLEHATAEKLEIPFPVMSFPMGQYKLHGVVTNRMEMPANDLILWHWGRCGKSEEAHAVMKEDLAGGQIGQNAAWWAIMLLGLQPELRHEATSPR